MAARTSSTLHSVNSRLKAVPAHQLPSIISQISRSLLDCKNLLSSPSSASKDSTDVVVLHTFRTHITTLLNGKTPEARWAAIVLIKTTVELGGHEILQTCKPWVNGLLSILAKPDAPTMKKLAILTLTRIFMLTHGHQTIIREVTTPALPAFVTACLNLVAPKNASKSMSAKMQMRVQAVLLQPVLECFALLVPRHPTIFRTFIPQLQAVLATYLAPTPSDVANLSESEQLFMKEVNITKAARKLHTLLHFSTAKSNSNNNNNSTTNISDTDYTNSLNTLLYTTHATADATFRSVIEDWTSTAGVTSTVSPTSYSSEVSSSHIESTTSSSRSSLSMLPKWTGIYAGCERLIGLLDLLNTYLTTSHTTVSVTIPIGTIIDLLVRITSVTVPSTKSASSGNSLLDTSIRSNEQISRIERESLFTQIPNIHTSALRVVNALLTRFSTASTSYLQVLLQQTTWIFAAEAANARVRRECYKVGTTLLSLSGRSLDKETTKSLFRMMKRASADILNSVDHIPTATINLPSTSTSSSNKKPAPAPTTTLNESSLLTSATTTALSLFTPSSHATHKQSTPLQLSALKFVASCLLRIQSAYISPSIRAQLDRAAVLSNDRDAMLASVLNPPANKSLAKSHSSILPLLARGHGERVEVEGLVRPRMPVLGVMYGGDSDEDEDEKVEDDEDEDEDEHAMADDNDEVEREVDSGAGMEDGDVISREIIEAKAQPAFPRRQTNPLPDDASATESPAPPSSLKRPPPAMPLPSPDTKKPRHSPPQPASAPKQKIPTAIRFINSSVTSMMDGEQGLTDTEADVLDVPVTTTTNEGQVVTTAATDVAAPHALVEDDDDDDFEIPELNMDPDTEDEAGEEE